MLSFRSANQSLKIFTPLKFQDTHKNEIPSSHLNESWSHSNPAIHCQEKTGRIIVQHMILFQTDLKLI